MYLDASGRVTACGLNQTVLLGRVGETPLREMWEGRAIAGLRAALADGDLSRGCQRCADQLRTGSRTNALAASFDHFEVGDTTWPKRLELAMSTRCNLQCTMCSGEFSSSIRAQRERLPPLPARYDDAFFEELRPFLHHVEQVRFLGGEPFLAEESFRVWDLMREEGVQPESNVTTNGTRYTRRIAQVLEDLPFSIGVSIDGVRPETVERIRAGASYEQIMANVRRFQRHTAAWGRSLSLTFCVMVDNWRELGDFLLLGEDLGCRVYLNAVHQPPAHSLFRLPPHELAEMVATMDRQTEDLLDRLHLNRDVWLAQVARLHQHLDHLHRVGAPSAAEPWLGLLTAVVEAGPDVGAVRRVLAQDRRLGTAVGELHCDAADDVVHADAYAGLPADRLVGRPLSVLRDLLLEAYGSEVELVADLQDRGVTTRVVELRDGERCTTMVTATFAARTDAGPGSVRVCGLGHAAAVSVALTSATARQ
jgi:MoaA/NifB/PqqE/SkfB family radical SAM enzyme